MLLYRARSIASRPTRLLAAKGNAPADRVVGRWFTNDIEQAHLYLNFCESPAEIVALEIADDIAETYSVKTTPVTVDGLSPLEHSVDPDSDYLIPRWFAAKAEAIDMVSDEFDAERMAVIYDANKVMKIEERTGTCPHCGSLPLAA